MTTLKVIFLCFLVFSGLASLLHAAPEPPSQFPPQFFAWMVANVIPENSPPSYSFGQYIAYDSANQLSWRFNEQDLLNPTNMRPNDYCDYTTGLRYHLNDTTGNPSCAGMTKISDFTPLSWPQSFSQNATYLGTDRVNDNMCDHFYMRPFYIDGLPYQMDAWVTQVDQLPCQITIQPIFGQPVVITSWAFTGILDTIPAQAYPGSAAKIQCAQKNWICQPKAGTSDSALQESLNYICSGRVDCSPIRPGGSNFYPNTLLDHSKWAFQAYFDLYKMNQGYMACYFNGNGEFVPPSNQTSISKRGAFDSQSTPLFPLQFVCPSM